MPDEMTMMTFVVKGKSNLNEIDITPIAQLQANGSSTSSESAASDEEIAIKRLNKDSEKMAKQIEADLNEILPPLVTVRADVSFHSGSIAMTATIMIISWVGSEILNGAKEVFSEELRQLVKISVQRVMNRINEDNMTPMTIDRVDPVISPNHLNDSKTDDSSIDTVSQNLFSKDINQLKITNRWLIGAVSLVFLLLCLLVFNQYFDIVRNVASLEFLWA